MGWVFATSTIGYSPGGSARPIWSSPCPPDDPVVRLAVFVETDVGLGQLRQPDHEVDAGVRVVGRPADAHLLEPHALVHQLAEGKPSIADAWGAQLRRSEPDPLAEPALGIARTAGAGHRRGEQSDLPPAACRQSHAGLGV